MLDGVVQGADAVRSVVVTIRSLLLFSRLLREKFAGTPICGALRRQRVLKVTETRRWP